MKKSDLNNQSPDFLIELIIELSKLNKENEAYLKSRISSNHNTLYTLYCKKIDKAFLCYELMSLKDARTALNDFKKSKPSNSKLIELYLYYIKRAYKLEKNDWRFQENFYSAIESVYNLIFDTLNKNSSLKESYLNDLAKMINISNQGWGHKDYLSEKLDELLKRKNK